MARIPLMRYLKLGIIAAITLAGIAWISEQEAYGHATTYARGASQGATGSNFQEANPSDPGLGGSSTITICAGTAKTVSSSTGSPVNGLVDPLSIQHKSSHGSVSLLANKCHDWYAGDVGANPTDWCVEATGALGCTPLTSVGINGAWAAQINDLTNVVPMTIEFTIPFAIMPESAVGAIALIGSSMAALGAYVGLKRTRAKI